MPTTTIPTVRFRSRCGAPVVDRPDHRSHAQMGTQPRGEIIRAAGDGAVVWELAEL